jgi:multicomponent Na+:H+ antiporter subunit E
MAETPSNTTTFGQRKQGWRGIAVQVVVLLTLWFVLSGLLDTFHIVLGIISVGAVVAFNYRLNQVQLFKGDEPEWSGIRFEFLFGFLAWLIWEIILGSLSVARVVLHPRMPVEPSILRFRVKLPRLGAKVLLGNVITLTPGTVTLDIKEDEFIVHTLTPGASANIIDGTMPKRVAQLYDHEEDHLVSEARVSRSGDELL